MSSFLVWCEVDTRNRWRDEQVCPDVRQGTMAPWARRLGCVLACYAQIGRGTSRETLGRKKSREKVGRDGENGRKENGEENGEEMRGEDRGDGERKGLSDWLPSPAFILERSRKWLLIGSTPTREKLKVAFDWLDPDEREAESGFGWAMKDNGVEPLCTQERVQQNSVGQWVGKEGWGSCHKGGRH
ncbi:hypothetical protein TNCV_1025861 [Trichonephila clavipes]|nr:hypothetical protein TNCV_1025861 [Trichonephila clavipes]